METEKPAEKPKRKRYRLAPKVGPPRAFTDEELILAIKTAKGNLAQVAKILNVSRTTICNHVNASQAILDLVEECREELLDFCEGKVIQHIANDSESMLQYYLNSQGRKRGYGKGLDSEISIHGTIERIIIESVKPSDD